MKTASSTFLVLSLVASTEAFVPPTTRNVKSGISNTLLYASQANDPANEAINAALEASKTYGPTSKEARVAWDIVEEINASDNSAAYKGSVSNVDKNKMSAEYEEKVQALSKILEDQKAQIESVKELANNIRKIKLVKPEMKAQPVSDAMVKALAEAKEASEKFGLASTEAKLAWETVEDIAQDDSSEAMKSDLSDECLIETIEACEAIEELQRALYKNENAGSGRYQG